MPAVFTTCPECGRAIDLLEALLTQQALFAPEALPNVLTFRVACVSCAQPTVSISVAAYKGSLLDRSSRLVNLDQEQDG